MMNRFSEMKWWKDKTYAKKLNEIWMKWTGSVSLQIKEIETERQRKREREREGTWTGWRESKMEMDGGDFWTGYNPIFKKYSIHSLDQFENQINEINDLREHDTEGCMPYVEWISRKYSRMRDERWKMSEQTTHTHLHIHAETEKEKERCGTQSQYGNKRCESATSDSFEDEKLVRFD